MKLYLNIINFGLLWFRQYPLEFIFSILKRVFQVIFIYLLWSIVHNNQEDPSLSLNQLLIYFMIVSSLSDILMVERMELGKSLSKSIKNGELNQKLIRPVRVIALAYAEVLGKMIPLYIVSTIFITFVIIFSGQLNLLGVMLFLYFMMIAILIGIIINILMGAIAFHVVDVQYLSYMFQIIIRIFSGVYIPLVFFANEVQNILYLTFFPYLAGVPVNSLLDPQSVLQNPNYLIIPWIWVLVGGSLIIYFWNRSLRSYEAIGI